MRELDSLGSGIAKMYKDVCELKKPDKSRVATHMGNIKHLKWQVYILSKSESTTMKEK